MSRNFNGFLIDCVRTVERHDYYFKLVDFMSDWKMDTLILHFSDDHGCAIKLPGFPELNTKHAFTVKEIKKLVSYADKKGIDIIPEIEAFGHSLYISSTKKYRHLFAGKTINGKESGSLDPLNLETLNLVKRLIDSTLKLFKSDYIHVGCDEVEIKEYCKMKGNMDADAVWADYVNRVIELVKQTGKKPMIWADHPAANDRIAAFLRKDVTILQWDYWENMEEEKLKRLIKHGFKDIVMSPSLACVFERFSPSRYALNNTLTGIRLNNKYKLGGIINTAWCPYRYVQGALYYGVAYSAYATQKKGKFKPDEFNALFVKKTFGVKADKRTLEFLKHLPELEIHNRIAHFIWDFKQHPANKEQIASAYLCNKTGRKILPFAQSFRPAKNKEIWDGMLLAARAAWITSEYFVMKREKVKDKRHLTMLDQAVKMIVRELEKDWDKTRHTDDPYKIKPKFKIDVNQAVISMLKNLKRL